MKKEMDMLEDKGKLKTNNKKKKNNSNNSNNGSCFYHCWNRSLH